MWIYIFKLSLNLVSCTVLFLKKFTFGISTEGARLSYLCIICPLGDTDKYIIVIYLSLGKYHTAK